MGSNTNSVCVLSVVVGEGPELLAETQCSSDTSNHIIYPNFITSNMLAI